MTVSWGNVVVLRTQIRRGNNEIHVKIAVVILFELQRKDSQARERLHSRQFRLQLGKAILI